MKQWNYSNARAQLTMIMDQAVAGHPVEITRRGRESAVIISKLLMRLTRKPNTMLLTIKSQFLKKIQKLKDISKNTLYSCSKVP